MAFFSLSSSIAFDPLGPRADYLPPRQARGGRRSHWVRLEGPRGASWVS